MFSLLSRPFHAEFCLHRSRPVHSGWAAPGRMKRQGQEGEHG